MIEIQRRTEQPRLTATAKSDGADDAFGCQTTDASSSPAPTLATREPARLRCSRILQQQAEHFSSRNTGDDHTASGLAICFKDLEHK